MRTKYIFTDIDGTLLDHGFIPPSSISALQSAKANGHKLYICTGRPVGILPKEIVAIIDWDGLVCSSGSYIELEHQIYLDYFFPDELQDEMIKVFTDNSVLYTLETNYAVFYSDPIINLHDGLDLKIFEYDKKVIRDKSFHKAIIFDPNRPLPETNKICLYSKDNPELLQYACDLLPQENVLATQVMPLFSGWYTEVLPRNISKSSAINYLVGNHKVPYPDTVAIGDSMNDYEMIKYAKTGICMGNGDNRLQEVADFVTDNLRDDGYARIFAKLGLI